MMLKSLFLKVISHKWEAILPVSAFILAFSLRYHFLTTYPHPLMIHEQDAVGYMNIAKSFLQFRLPPVTDRPPGYPIVIALFSILPVGLEYAARLASIFMDSLVVLPLYYLARVYGSRLGAFATALLWSAFSFSLYFSTSPLSQSSFLAYLLIGVVFLHHAFNTTGIRWFLFAGILSALSFLARPEGFVGFCYGLLICATHIFQDNREIKRKLTNCGYFFLGFSVLAGPYLVAMRVALGGWTLSALTAMQVKSADAVLTLNSQGKLQGTSTGLSAWRDYFSTIPSIVNSVLQNIQDFAAVHLDTFPMWFNLLSIAGFFLLIWKRKWRESALLLVFFAVILPIFVINLPKKHSYLYPFFVMHFLCFGYCLDTIQRGGNWAVDKFLSIQRYEIFKHFFSVILFLPVVFVMLSFYTAADDSYRAPGLTREAMATEMIFKRAGETIRNHSSENDLIMSRWGLIGYFADRPVVLLPKGGVKQVIEFGRKKGARFLLIDTESVYSRRQELVELLGPLEGKYLKQEYGLEAFSGGYVPGLGGYVIYRYKE